MHTKQTKPRKIPRTQETITVRKVTHVILMLRVLILTPSTRVPVVRASKEMGFIVRTTRGGVTYFLWAHQFMALLIRIEIT
uniref:Uncharacterized protein n=1 Tax=Phlebotomus papatasi TaxID=29031 RepID=A0A1B0DPJ2_PHLPP